MQLTLDIRYCKPEDYKEVLELVKISVKSVLPDEEFEEEKIRDLFDKSLINDDFTCICLIVDGKVKGYILGYITEHYFHSKSIAYCMSIYVDEDYRKYGLEMIRSFEAWGKYKGAKTLSMSSFKGLSPDKFDVVLKRLKYIENEKVYWKEV